MKYKHHYFVSYVFVRDNVLTFGHCTVDGEKRIDNSEEISQLAKDIAEANKIDRKVTIITYIKIKRKE